MNNILATYDTHIASAKAMIEAATTPLRALTELGADHPANSEPSTIRSRQNLYLRVMQLEVMQLAKVHAALIEAERATAIATNLSRQSAGQVIGDDDEPAIEAAQEKYARMRYRLRQQMCALIDRRETVASKKVNLRDIADSLQQAALYTISFDSDTQRALEDHMHDRRLRRVALNELAKASNRAATVTS